jgi:predicted metalloprotease with PDZ domain
MKYCRYSTTSFCRFLSAILLNLLALLAVAQSQTTKPPAANGQFPVAPSDLALAPGKTNDSGELPPPPANGERTSLPSDRNPFPTAGLVLPLAEGKDRPGGEEAAAEPGYFGAITDDRQKIPGVRIVEVVAGGPAELAGLLAGDLITGVDGQPIREMADLAKIFTLSHAGQQLKIEYQRGATLNTPGQTATLAATLGKRPIEKARRYAQFGRIDEEALPQNESQRPSGMLLGVRTAPLDLAGQRRLGVPIQAGAMVLDVTPGSPAALAGIPRDAVIVSLNGLLIDSPDALTREILQAGPGMEVEIGYYLGRNSIRRRIVLGGSPRADSGNPRGQKPGPEADAARIEQLEQQVQELQRRIEVLERALRK